MLCILSIRLKFKSVFYNRVMQHVLRAFIVSVYGCIISVGTDRCALVLSRPAVNMIMIPVSVSVTQTSIYVQFVAIIYISVYTHLIKIYTAQKSITLL